jgi:hypothetical protein
MTMTDDDARRRTAEARAKLWSTLRGQKVNASDADTGTAVEYRPISDVIKLNAAKQEMRNLLAGMPATVVKQNAGIRSVIEDSNQTNLEPGQGVYDGGYQVTSRGRTLEQLLADQDVPTPIPAITNRQTAGQSDWSPDTANDDYSADQPFNADKARDDLLAHYTKKDGTISG